MIELKNITKIYKDGAQENTVLDQVSMNVRQGELVAIVGPSGSGKSTLLSIAGALLSPTEGDILIRGENISKMNQKERTRIRRNKIGFIFQNHQLLPYLTGEEQLKIFQERAHSSISVQKMVEDLELESCIRQYPAKMSGGERQRVAIARAFMSEPEVILADEPTASLDGNRGRVVVEMIRKETEKWKKAAIMVTHDERMLDLADRVYMLENGQLIRR